MRRELPPPAPTLSATSAPVAAPTPVVAHAADLVGGAAARVAETEGSPQECRPYTSARTAVGLNRPVRGLACRRPDGRWQLVTEMPDN
jgi:surface antigen